MKIGDIFESKIIITDITIQKFAEFSGDYNPVHFDRNVAISKGFKDRIAHGMLSAAFFSKILATDFPGPGTIYLGQNLKFHDPVYLNDEVFYRLEVVDKKADKPIFTIKTEAFNKEGSLYISGEAVIKAPF